MSEFKENSRFSGFYDDLGGMEVLGPEMSPVFARNGVEYQYTTSAMMFFDPSLPRGQRYGLMSLGLELGIAETATDANAPGGHPIHEKFRNIYDSMGKARYTGLPLTDGRYNAERSRFEQYFENVGFYQLDADPTGVVNLIEYGAWYCAEHCDYDAVYEAAPTFGILTDEPFDETFSEAIQRYYSSNFIGEPLTEPYFGDDGLQEQIFENVVVVEALNMPGGIGLEPVPALLGVQTQHNANLKVPSFFKEYILINGGWEFAGEAITVYERRSDDLYRQCFTNLCLDYYPNHIQGQQVRVTPLGYAYHDRYYVVQAEQQQPKQSQTQDITLAAWEEYPVIAPNEQQVIGVAVYANSVPLGEYEPVLTLSIQLADKSDLTYAYSFAPTSAETGKSSLTINPIEAPHGTRVLYEVCAWRNAPSDLCVLDDFLIWW
ncbi:MAG: hypothetical protein ABFS03_06115 [Chloroflexota bacterium]